MFLRIFGAMVWVGGALVLTSLALWTLRQPDAAAVGRFAASLRTIAPAVLALAPTILLAAALWLVLDWTKTARCSRTCGFRWHPDAIGSL
jgi:hypothetical protein